MACDDAVLANTGNPRAYASCLIELLEKSCARRGWTMAQAAVHRAQELSQRITRILDPKRPASTRVWKPALALATVFSLACFAISFSAPRLVAFKSDDSQAAAKSSACGYLGSAQNAGKGYSCLPLYSVSDATSGASNREQENSKATPLP
jgi:hypothetical protein